MSYYGKFPQFEQYLTDGFTSNATTYAAGYPLTYNPGVAQAIEVYVGAAQQRPNVDYVVNNQTLIFTPAIPDGLSIFVRYLGVAGTPAVIQDASVTASKLAETVLSKSVAGGANVTLSAIEAANSIYQFTGNLTANINVIVPNNVRRFVVDNLTAGNYTLTVTTAAGTGVTVVQGFSYDLYCDGTNVVSGTGVLATATSALIPSGPTAQRSNPARLGEFRMNTDTTKFEGYFGSAWKNVGGATGAGSDSVFYENDMVVTQSYTIGQGGQVAIGLASTVFTNASATIMGNNNFVVGQQVFFTANGALPTNFTTLQGYWVVAATSTSFQVSATQGGTAIVAGSAGSGTVTVSVGLLKSAVVARALIVLPGQSVTIPGGAGVVVV